MPTGWPRTLFALALPCIAVLLRWAFADYLPHAIYTLLFPAVFLAGWIGGPSVCLAATVLGAVLTDFFLMEPRLSLSMQVGDVVPTIVFVATGVGFAWFQFIFRGLRERHDRLAATQQMMEQRWSLAVEAGGFGLWEWDIAGKQVKQTPQYRKMLGYQAETDVVLPDNTIFEDLHPDDVAAVQAAVAPHLAGTTATYDAEFRIRCCDGHYIWVESRGRVVRRGPQGEPLLMLGTHVDVTARHEQMQAVSRAKDELQCALRSMNDAVCLFDANGALIECNEAFVAFVREPEGAAPLATMARFTAVFECFRPDRTPIPPGQWPGMRALTGSSGTDERLILRRIDTGEEWVASFSYAPLRSPAGVIWGAVIVARDITDQLRLEESLRAANERLQRAYETQSLALKAGDFGAFEFSLPDRVLMCSDECRRLCGLQAGTMATLADMQATMHAEDRARMEVAIDRGIASGEVVDEEYRVIWPDGSLHWLRWTGRVIREGSRPVRFAGLMRASRNNEMHLLAEGIQQMVWVADGRKVIYCNQQWLDFCGATMESQLGYGWIASLHPDDQARLRDAVAAPMGPEVTRLEQSYRLRRHDGEYRWCISRGRRLQATPDAKPLWYGSTMDVHDLHVAIEKAQSADRAKAAFLATTSHELRTPLNSIIGFTTLLLAGEMGPLRAEQRKPLEVVHRSSQQLLALVQDVLDFTSIEAGTLKLSIQPVPLASVLNDVREQLLPGATARGLELPAVECDAGLAVLADSARLGQAVRNLVANGVNYTDRGFVRISAAAEGDFARIDVQDSGIGIPAGEMHKLFRAFDPIERGERVVREGTGLGLVITRRIVESMGGGIGCTSESGVGSHFWIKVPLAR